MRNLIIIIPIHVIFAINMEGIYESQLGKAYESDAFKWNMWEPNFYLETRFYGNPINNSSFYFKLNADQDYSESNQSLLVFSEGHVSYKIEDNNKGLNTTFFMRESNPYWLDGSMLGIINTGAINNDGNGQGVRFDSWHPSLGSMTYVFSDFSQGSGDDIHLLRYRKSLFNNKMNTGISYLRKHYFMAESYDYNQVIAYDLKVQKGRYYFSTEFAVSEVPSDLEITELNKEIRKKNILKSNIAMKTELFGLQIGKPELGYYFLNPGIFSYGHTYRNYMGNNESNRYGYWLNSYYLLPQRAITLTLNYSFSKKIITDSIPSAGIYDPIQNIYSEIYIEFINGFKGKISFNKKDENWQGKSYKHYDLLTEISVENNLAKLLGQFKIKDINEVWEKHIFGIELSVNLAEQWKFFNRGIIANDRAGSRYSIFTELQYKSSDNTELYLQYGPSYWGQYGLVNDDGFTSSGEMKKEVKVIIKGWF